MVDEPTRRSREERIRLLTRAYRSILERYREIERLSERERKLLRTGHPVADVNRILRTKRELLGRIREEEEGVRREKEWWKRARRSLPPERSRELLSLLEAISRKIERTLALEAECRSLLNQALGWGVRPAGPPGSATAAAATVAYARGVVLPGREETR